MLVINRSISNQTYFPSWYHSNRNSEPAWPRLKVLQTTFMHESEEVPEDFFISLALLQLPSCTAPWLPRGFHNDLDHQGSRKNKIHIHESMTNNKNMRTQLCSVERGSSNTTYVLQKFYCGDLLDNHSFSYHTEKRLRYAAPTKIYKHPRKYPEM